MRVSRLPASASRSVLMIGMPPPTAASKESCAPRSSASFASSTPCAASSALLAVTTPLPVSSAARTLACAGPSSPPISSTKTSMELERARPTGSSCQAMPSIAKPRSRARSRALTAATRPSGRAAPRSASPWRSSSRTTDAPTVPSPAMPSLSGSFISPCPAGENQRLALIGTTLCNVLSAEARKRPMLRAAWRMRCSFSTSAMRTIAVAVLAEAEARRHRHVGLLDQELGELEAAELRGTAPGSAPRRTCRRVGAGIGQPARAKRVDHHVAAPAVDRAHLVDALVRPVQRRRGGDLHRRVGAVVEIGFHARQRRDQPLVADREADAQARHRERLRHGGELHRHLDRARHLQHRGRRLAVVEIDLGVGEVGEDEDARSAARRRRRRDRNRGPRPRPSDWPG